jgi:NAD(P)-dependent dehydrogenase (short-subunit alcohol dehydrogenase family)
MLQRRSIVPPSTVVITGASRGIGGALAVAAARPGRRLVLLARPSSALDAVAERARAAGAQVQVLPVDLRDRAATAAAGERLAADLPAGSVLVHCAGIWPARRELTADGLEAAFVVNHLSALWLQRPALAAGRLGRILDVSAGLIVKGRVDAERTPTGADFSALGTYCTTKLCRAVALRATAAEHPDLDVLVLHPGVVRTDLGARRGPLGLLLRLAKRRWEDPATCAARLAATLDEPGRWAEPGEAAWRLEDRPEPWPPVAADPATAEAVRAATARAEALTRT